MVGQDHKELISTITDAIAHRGPDDFGYSYFNNISLGHRRLAIQDLSSNGHQPMFTEDGRYCIVFNGEIYNHWDIRKDLESKYSFKSTSDTETLLYGYVEYGTDLFNKLNGIFAFAIFDVSTGDLILVRDQFGVKPLYYYHKDDCFIFSSELKSINQVPFLDRTIDAKGLFNYVKYLWSPGERTPMRYIKKLLPGNFLRLNVNHSQDVEFTKYYSIPFTGSYKQKDESEWIEDLEKCLLASVERQLLSDVPVGFFLSGGLDSSAIVALAKKILPNKTLKCYTVDTCGKEMIDEGFSDDLKYARVVAKHLNVELIEVKGSIDIMSSFDKMIYHLDEPQADTAPLHVLNICTQARKDGIIVLLGGTAGDDVFSGYRRHQALRYESLFNIVPKFVFKALKSLVGLINITNPKLRRIKKVLFELDKTPEDRQIGYFSWTSDSLVKNLFSDNNKKRFLDYNSNNIFKESLKEIPNESNSLNKMLFLELKHFLPDHNLNYTDKLSMAVGVEVRVPFLDKELVEFSTKIPPHLKMKGITTKYLLKKVMEKYLPHEVIYRSKAGFGAPVRTWIKGDLKDYISKIFSIENINRMGIFNYDKVNDLVKDNQDNKLDGSYTILSLLSINSWFKQFHK